MQASKAAKQRVPRVPVDPMRTGGVRGLFSLFCRAVELTAGMDAERQIILSIAFAHVFEMPLDKFTAAVRKHRRRPIRERLPAHRDVWQQQETKRL